MKFLVYFFLFIQSTLYACAICATEVPQVIIDVEITSEKDKTSFDVKWKFHKEFTDALTQYDLNENKIFDEDEKNMIKQSLLDYLTKFHYLTDIEYKHQERFTETLYEENITAKSSALDFTGNGMVFHYIFDLPFNLKNKHNLFIGFSDEGGNFDFILQNILLKNYPNAYTLSKEFSSSTIKLDDPNVKSKDILKKIDIKEEVIIEDITPLNKPEIISEKTFIDFLSEKLTKLKEDLKLILKDIKDNNSFLSYLWLLFFSFLYGVLHAIGPGHGKSLVGSYFLQKNNSYIKALSVSLLIGVVHTFSAFLLTLVVYHSVGFIFNSTIVNVEQISTKVSAVIIIIIALYLLYKKINKTKTKMTFTKAQVSSKITMPKTTHVQSLSCACNSCKTTSTDLGVILAAGIIPCPGTVTIFLFTMGLGIYFVGFLSAIFMSLGMSLIIFLTAVISVKVRQTSTQNNTLIKILEYTSLAFILSLGITLFFIS